MSVPVGVDHYLEVNGVELHSHAWFISDLTPLLSMPQMRGADRLIPGASGLVPYVRRSTATERTMPLWVTGGTDKDGVVNTDSFLGLHKNIDFLLANVMKENTAGDGTYAATFHRPTGVADLTANIHVIGFEATTEHAHSYLRYDFTISIPDGAFT